MLCSCLLENFISPVGNKKKVINEHIYKNKITIKLQTVWR